MGGERISQEVITEPVENNAQEGEIDGISNVDFLKSIGVNPEKRSNTLSQLEAYFGDRVFHYGQYSGTIAEMVQCPVFYSQLEEGFDAAANWLLEYDEPQEETAKADLLKERPENEHESIGFDIDSRQTQEHNEKVEVAELHSPLPKKVIEKTVTKSTIKDVPVKKSTETKSEVRDGVGKKGIPTEYIERPVNNDERATPVVKEVLENTIERINKNQDAAIEATELVEPETLETSEIIVENTEPIQPEVVEKHEDSLSITPQENLSTFSIPQTSLVEAPVDLPLDRQVEPEPIASINEVEVVPSSMNLEQMLPVENEPIFTHPVDVQEEVEQFIEPNQAVSMIETVAALTDIVPEMVIDIEPEKVYYQAEAITQKIKVFETLTTAEECRAAVDSLRGELELLLIYLGYKNAEEIAMNVLRQHDTKTIVEYMTVLKRSITQSYGSHSAPYRILKALLPYHRYGTHAVRNTVTSYA